MSFTALRSRPASIAREFAALVLVLATAACGEAIDGGNAPAAPKKAEAKPKVEEVAVAPTEQWFYNPAGKRDPFSSFLARTAAANQVSPDAPPLQRWDTDRFVLTGVIWNVDTPRALLVDPEGIGHVVRTGTYVGRNWGKVTSISEDGVIVTEEYRMIDGELVVNPVSIRFGGAPAKK